METSFYWFVVSNDMIESIEGERLGTLMEYEQGNSSTQTELDNDSFESV